MAVVDLLLSSRKPDSFFVGRAIGYLFLVLAMIGGMFFLFQRLVPLIGYIESGMVVCGMLGGIGGILLFLNRSKTTLPEEDFSEKAVRFFKDLDMERILKNNAFMISLLSFGVGIALSQFKDPRKLSEFYKMLK